MNTNQTTLIDDPDNASSGTVSDRKSTVNTTTSINLDTLAPPDQRGGDGCCPWCLASAEMFRHHDDGSVGCGHCDAAIPVGVEWYERGEKIVV